MAQLKDDMIPFISEKEINEIIDDLVRKIQKDYEGEEIVIVCPLNGPINFCADLVRKLDLRQRIEFVKLKSLKNGSVSIEQDISFGLKDCHVLIIEEIIDAGRTLKFLRDRIMLDLPESVKIVTLIDKPARREIPLRPDYIGKTIEDRFVVGYGMDSEEYGRNYKDIYIFRQ